MLVARRIGLVLATLGLLLGLMVTPAAARERTGPQHGHGGAVLTKLASFGGGGWVLGSTIGPDGALYVTDGNAGSVLRIDRRSGRVSTYATGLPRKVFPAEDIGGAVDVLFVGRTAYVLVTLVSGRAAGEPFGDVADKNGIYRLNRDGSFTLVADIGGWSVDHPPRPAFFVDTGVQYSMERYGGRFLVADGHHNRVLSVGGDGSIREVAAFGDVVPTGLEVARGRVFVSQAGSIPHDPADGRVVRLRRGADPAELARGASLLVDVERGAHRRLYALSQGTWDGVGEGSPALPSTGRLLVVGRHGGLTPVVDGRGQDLVLDRPVSMEFVGHTGYVVSLIGDVYRVDHL